MEILVQENNHDVSYDAIHELLWAANQDNRKNGFRLQTAELTGAQIEEKIGPDGICYVALDGERLAGTVSVCFSERNTWYYKGMIPEIILVGVLPEYQGQHVMSRLFEKAFADLQQNGFQLTELNTAENNYHAIAVYEHMGFKKVSNVAMKNADHYSVVMVKWFDKCPFSELYRSAVYGYRVCRTRLLFKKGRIKRFGTGGSPMKRNLRRVLKSALFHNRILSLAAAAGATLVTPGREKKQIKAARSAYFEEGHNKKATLFDILFCRYYYQISPEEYYRYRFYNLNNAGRKEYVGEEEFLREFRTIDDPDTIAVLADKYKSYQKFKDYYRREAILVSGENGEELKAFLLKHGEAIVKPLQQFGGHGIRKVSVSDPSEVDRIVQDILDAGSCIAEEVIDQADPMARFHPQSVNTLRTVTLRGKEGVEVIQSSVRLGTGESIVDNGCLSAAVDVEHGIILTKGREAHKSGLFALHPDTGEQIIGSRIPKWEEAISLSKQLADEIPDQRLAGWDLAYTSEGWTMIEGNAHPAIQILAGEGQGVRELFEKIMSTSNR